MLKELFGEANETVTIINGHACIGLLDTGSQITSIAESFYRRHLADCTIQPLGNLVRVVGAGGQDIPYLGYTTVKIQFPVEDVAINTSFDTPVLVVPDNEYNRRVPVIVGTNLVRRSKCCCESEGGSRFLQTRRISSAWQRVYKSMCHQEKCFARDSQGIKVQSTTRHAITIGSHQTKTVMCLANATLATPTDVLLETVMPSQSGLIVTPGFFTLPAGVT